MKSDWFKMRELRAYGVKIHISPFEDPRGIVNYGDMLICNAGVDTFTITPQGDVFRCLTWFRSKWRWNAYMGNIFASPLDKDYFKPLDTEKPCSLKCDIFYILDPKHKQKEMFSTRVRRLK
jgi:hypothetical protein